MDLDNLDAALQDFDRSVALDPTLAHPVYNRGFLHHRAGRVTDALRDYDTAIKLAPSFSAAYSYDRGSLREATQDHEGAMQDANEAIRINANAPDGFRLRSKIHESLGDLAAAIRDSDEVIRLSPDERAAMDRREFLLKESGTVDRQVETSGENPA